MADLMMESFYPSPKFRLCDQNHLHTNGLRVNIFPSIENTKRPWYHNRDRTLEMTGVTDNNNNNNTKNRTTTRNLLKKSDKKTHRRVHGSLTFYQCLLDYLQWWKNTFIQQPPMLTSGSAEWKPKRTLRMSPQYPQPELYSKSLQPKRSHRIRLLPNLGKDNFKSKTGKFQDNITKKTPKQKEKTLENKKLIHGSQNLGEIHQNSDKFFNPFHKNNYSVLLSRNGLVTIFNSADINEILRKNAALLKDPKGSLHKGKKNPNFAEVLSSKSHKNFKTNFTQHKNPLNRKELNKRVTKNGPVECFRRIVKRPLSSASIAIPNKNNKTRVRGLSRLLKTFSNKIHLFDEYKIIADGVEMKTPCINLVGNNYNTCVENNMIKSSCQHCILTANNRNQTLPYKILNKSTVNLQYNVKNQKTENPTLKEQACELLFYAEKIAKEKCQAKDTKTSPNHNIPNQKRHRSQFETNRKSTKPSFKLEKSECQKYASNKSIKENETKCISKFLQLKIPSIQDKTNIVFTYEDKKSNRRINFFDEKNNSPGKEEPLVGKITKCLIPAVQCKREANIISFDLDRIREQCRNQQKKDVSGGNHNPLCPDISTKEQDKSKKEKIKKYLDNFPSLTNEQIKSILSNKNTKLIQSFLCIPLCSDAYYYVNSKDHDLEPVKDDIPSFERNLSEENIKSCDEETKPFKPTSTTPQDKKEGLKQLKTSDDLSCMQEPDSTTTVDKLKIICQNELRNTAANDNFTNIQTHTTDNASRKRYVIEIEDSNSQILNEIINFIESKEESQASYENLSYCLCYLKNQHQLKTEHHEHCLGLQSQTDLQEKKCPIIEKNIEKQLKVNARHHDYSDSNSTKYKFSQQKYTSHHQKEQMLKYNKFHKKNCQQKQPKSSKFHHKSTKIAKNIWTKALSTLGTKVEQKNSHQKHQQQYLPRIKLNALRTNHYKNVLQKINGPEPNQFQYDCHNRQPQYNKNVKQQTIIEPIREQAYASFIHGKEQKINIKNKLQPYNRNLHQHKMYSPYYCDQCQHDLQNKPTEQCGTAYRQQFYNKTQPEQNFEKKCDQCTKDSQRRLSEQQDKSFKEQPFSRNQQNKVYLPRQNHGGFQNNQAQQKNDPKQKPYYMKNQLQNLNKRTKLTKQLPENMKNKQQQEYGLKFEKCSTDLHNRPLVQSSLLIKKQQVDKKSEIPAFGQNCKHCAREYHLKTFQNDKINSGQQQYQKTPQQFTEQTDYPKKEYPLNHEDRIRYLENYIKGCGEYNIKNERIQAQKKYLETSQIMNLQIIKSNNTEQKTHQRKLKRLELEQGLQCLEHFIEECEKDIQSECQQKEEVDLELYLMSDNKQSSFERVQELQNKQRIQYLEQFLQECEQEKLSNKRPLKVLKTADYCKQQQINEAKNRLQRLQLTQTQQRIQTLKKSLKGTIKLQDQCKDENKPLEPLRIDNQTYQGNDTPKMNYKIKSKSKMCPKDSKKHHYGVLQNKHKPQDNEKYLPLDQELFERKQTPPKSIKYRTFQDVNKEKTNFIICKRCVYSNLIYTLPAKLRRLSPLIDENSKYLHVCLICEDKFFHGIPSVPSEQEMQTFYYGRNSTEMDEPDSFPVYFRPPTFRAPSNKEYAYWMMGDNEAVGDGSELCVHPHSCLQESSYEESGLGSSGDEGDFVILNQNLCYSYGVISIQCLDQQVEALNKMFRG